MAYVTLTQAASEAAHISEHVEQLQRRVLTLERAIARSHELVLNANSWRHSIPFFWHDPVIHTAHWVRYWDVYPRPPQEPVEYCRDRDCERLTHVRNDHLIWPDPGWEWLEGREHVWRPCARCLARERAEVEAQRFLGDRPGRGPARSESRPRSPAGHTNSAQAPADSHPPGRLPKQRTSSLTVALAIKR